MEIRTIIGCHRCLLGMYFYGVMRFSIQVFMLFGLSQMVYGQIEGCPQEIHNSYECAQYLEAKLGKRNPQLFRRDDKRLEIFLDNGESKIFVDGKQEVGDDANYNIVEYFPSVHLCVIHVQYWEGSEALVLSLRDGTETDVKGYPVISPDNKRMAVFAFDVLANYGPNILSVYKIKNGYLELEYRIEPEEWGPRNVEWVNNEKIAFIKTWYDSEMNEKSSKNFLIHNNLSGWKLLD